MKTIKESTRKFLKKSLKLILLAHFGLFAVVFLFIAACSFINPPVNSLMIYRTLVYNYKIHPVHYIPLRQIPWDLRSMLITLEDCNFNKHFGIDPEAMMEAFFINLKMKKRSIGASTIDQQLARTLFLYPKKSFFRKYLEILIALEMDLFMNKDRILELYFNSVEWGRGVFGVQSASYYYFNKGVNELDRDEMMRLVTILPSPVKYGPTNFYNLHSLNQRYNLLRALDETNRVLNAAKGLTNGADLTNLPAVPLENTVIDTNLANLSEEDAEDPSDDNR